MHAYKMTVDKMFAGKITLDKMFPGKINADKTFVVKMTGIMMCEDNTCLGKVYVYMMTLQKWL